MIDSHTHLDLCEPPDAELVAAAERAGVSRIVTVGIDGSSCRAALAVLDLLRLRSAVATSEVRGASRTALAA